MSSDSMSESHPMNGGDGSFSYNNNSDIQRKGISFAKDIIVETITEKLDVTEFSPTPITTFNIADMGCSVGPNTFFSVQNIIEAVRTKSLVPEFQVFFNDHVSNDFNTLFASLPLDRHYYAAGVPGPFHTRLFPESSLHVVHSSYALHWLSKVPNAVLDRNSPAWNKGRVYFSNAPDEVGKAYLAQFMKDMGGFLSARAEEIVKGGLMVLVMPGNQDGMPNSRVTLGFVCDLLGFSLMDMVMEGKISEDKVDSFNMPVYAPCPSDMVKLVEANGCFTIERLEVTFPGLKAGEVSGEAITAHVRAAGVEGLIGKHFGSQIIDELFDRYRKKAEEDVTLLNSRLEDDSQLIVILKRK